MDLDSAYQLLFEMSNDGIVLHEFTTTGSRGRFLAANDAVCRLLGYTAEEMSHLTPLDIMSPGEASDVPQDAEVMQREGTLVHEEHLLAKGGRSIPVEISSRMFEFEGRTLALSVIRDVTERKRTEAALRESEERFRTMADGCPAIIWATNAQGGNQFVNRTYREYFGVDYQDVEGGQWQPFFHPADAPAYVEGFLRAVREQKPFTGEARARRKDAAYRWVATYAEPRFAPGGEFLGHVGITQDISDRRHLEEQLRQAQKLESVGRLAGGVAHDFNNILSVILSAAEVLKSDLESGLPATTEYLDEILGAAKRAADLTRHLLAFARKQVIAPVVLDLNELVRGAEKLLRRVLGEDVEIVTTLQPDLWTARCDPGQIEQVVLNLAVNARDAMPSGGTLTIESANAQVGDALVATHPFMRAGPHVRLSIQDSGLGMSPEVKAHLFEPFFTTKPEGHGTGLGLATVYGIVKQSEGYILIESEPGRGTRVDLYFPRIEEAKAAAKPALPPTARGTEAVLLVEDDAQVRRIAVRALQAAGYRAIVASTGREALDLAEREGSEFDLLLTDVIMPGLNGRELAETLRRRRPNLRVLYMSGYTQDVISQAGVLDSGIEFLPKPFTPELLQESVRRALDVGWAQRLATGIGEIDAQHQILLVRVEALEKAAREGNVSDAPNLVMLVERYASEHFATEEEFMRAAGYPGLGDHHALHRTFVDELKSRKAEYEASHPHPSALKGFSDWFTSWLRDHIRGADAEMASYLRGASS